MRVFIIILLAMIVTKTHGQVPLGIGLAKVEFNDKTVLNFYSKPDEASFVKGIEFFTDDKINAWNIRNLDKVKSWLKPQELWLDYSRFVFRCKIRENGWLEVIINNGDGQTFWIKESQNIMFLGWEDYFKGMFAVHRSGAIRNKKSKALLLTVLLKSITVERIASRCGL